MLNTAVIQTDGYKLEEHFPMARGAGSKDTLGVGVRRGGCRQGCGLGMLSYACVARLRPRQHFSKRADFAGEAADTLALIGKRRRCHCALNRPRMKL
jgi:hypothetical protein